MYSLVEIPQTRSSYHQSGIHNRSGCPADVHPPVPEAYVALLAWLLRLQQFRLRTFKICCQGVRQTGHNKSKLLSGREWYILLRGHPSTDGVTPGATAITLNSVRSICHNSDLRCSFESEHATVTGETPTSSLHLFCTGIGRHTESQQKG